MLNTCKELSVDPLDLLFSFMSFIIPYNLLIPIGVLRYQQFCDALPGVRKNGLSSLFISSGLLSEYIL